MGTNGNGSSVLLIGSEPSRLRELRSVLDSIAVEIDAVQSLDEALDKLREHDYSALLVEAHDPHLDGIQILRRIRAHERWARLRVLLLDAEADKASVPDDAFPLRPGDIQLPSSFPELIQSHVQLLVELHREKARAHLFEQKHRSLRTLLDRMQDAATVSLDKEGRIVEWGPAAQRIFGYVEEEIRGQNVEVLFTEENRAEGIPRRELSRAQAVGQSQIEQWYQRRNGQMIFLVCLLIATRDRRGKLRGYTKFIRDETDSKRANDALHLSEERYRIIAQASNDVIYDWDMQTNAISWNEAMGVVFGYGSTEFTVDIGWWSERVHPDDIGRITETFHRALEDQVAVWEEDYRFRKADGTYALTHERGHLIRDGSGRAIRMLGAMVDVTERRRFEEEIRRARDLAVEANTAKSQFLATMSHELRSPLTAIIGYTELLQEEVLEASAPPHIYEDLKKIRAAGDHLLTVISEVLDLSKIDAGKMELSLERFDMGQIIDEAVATVQPELKKKELGFRTQWDCQNRTIFADATRVRQILINLLANAIKFTHQGEVMIRCARKPGEEDQEWFLVAVTDTGIGISEDQLQRLFQRFGQLDASSTRQYGGAGLGLAISKLLCDLMGGRIEVQSEPGKGSTFSVWLPSVVKPARA